mgnify:CR=1 FL=1
MNGKQRTLLSCAVSGVLGISPTSLAQEGPRSTSILEEIVVTAQKRSESLQDVPAAVSAFNQEQLTRTHATQLQDFAAYMPGINVNTIGQTRGRSLALLRRRLAMLDIREESAG